MTYKMTETARISALTYIKEKIENGVEMFMLESASHTEVLCVNALTLADFVETASLTRLDKIMRLNKGGVELRKVVYEASRSVEVLALVRRGTLIVKPYTAGNWQEGEKVMAAIVGGVRTGNEPKHVADLEIVKPNGKTIKVEVKNCEGRLY